MKGLNFFDVDLLYRNIKSIVHTRLQVMIDEDPEKGDDIY